MKNLLVSLLVLGFGFSASAVTSPKKGTPSKVRTHSDNKGNSGKGVKISVSTVKSKDHK